MDKERETLTKFLNTLVEFAVTYGGVILGIRYCVSCKSYFETRYRVNQGLLQALREAGDAPAFGAGRFRERPDLVDG